MENYDDAFKAAAADLHAAKLKANEFHSKWELLRAVAVLLLTFSMLGMAVIFVRSSWKDPSNIFVQPDQFTELRSQVNVLSAQVSTLKSRTEALEKGPASAAPLSAEVARLSADVDALNAAIQQSPEKSLAIPMLRKDLDSQRELTKNQSENTRAEIERIYDLDKWLIGTVVLGMISLTLMVFSQTRRQQQNEGK